MTPREMSRARKSSPLAPAAATRWAAWAARLAARRGRRAGASALGLSLHVRAARVPILLYRRWLSFESRIYPQLNLSIAGRGVWNVAPANVYAPRMVFLQTFGGAFRHPPATEAGSTGERSSVPPGASGPGRAAPPRRGAETAPRLALTLAVARTRAEHVSSTLQRHYTTRRESAVTELAERLTRTTRRLEEVANVRPEMALRKEAPPAPAPRPQPSAWPAEQAASEGRARATYTAPPPMPELNVEQLASQVLKHIDRRVVARRERMGQV